MSGIGESKRTGLFSNFKGLEQGTFNGTINTQRSWSDFETEPIIKKSLLETSNVSPSLKSRVFAPATRRLEDVARITKLLGRPGGIQWEAHMSEMHMMQNRLDSKKQQKIAELKGEGSDSFGEKVVEALKDLGKSLITSVGVTASTLVQVGLAGTGEHQTPYIRRAYLKKQSKERSTLGKIINAVATTAGVSDGDFVNGGKDALEGALIPTWNSDPENSYIRTAVQKEIKAEREGNWKVGKFTSVKQYDSEFTSGSAPQASLLGSTEVSGSHLQNAKDSFIYFSPKYLEGKETLLKDVSTESVDKFYGKSGIHLEDPLTTSSRVLDRYDSEEFEISSTVRQVGQAQPLEFADNISGSVINRGFKISNQYFSSSEDTTYEKWIRAREGGKVGYEADTRLRGTVVREEDSDRVQGEYKVKLREKPSDLETFTERLTEGSDDNPFGPNHDEVFFEKLGLIPFEISSITPEMRYYLAFPANLKDFKDDFTGTWTDTQYVGRAEKFHSYTGFDRQISFSFTVLARNKQYLNKLYQKLNKLAATTAPTYKDGIFMRGTLTSVTVGDYLVNQKGFFKSVGLSWNTDYMWEIEGDTFRLPLVLDVQVSFVPIHSFTPTSEILTYF